MDLKAMSKTKEVITLNKPLTIDELYDIMEQNKEMFPGSFKKGFGKSISFDVYMTIWPKIKIKGNTVIVRKYSKSSSVSIGGGPAVDIKAAKQSMGAIKEGGMKGALQAGPQYFNSICDNMVEILKDY